MAESQELNDPARHQLYRDLEAGDPVLLNGYRLMGKLKRVCYLGGVVTIKPSRRFGLAYNPMYSEDVIAAAGQFSANERANVVAVRVSELGMLGERETFKVWATNVGDTPLASYDPTTEFESVVQIYPPEA